MNEQNKKEFEKLARPLMKFLNDHYHPHISIIITADTAELLSGEMAFHTEDYIKD